MADGADGSAATGAASGTDGLLGRLGELAWRALPAIGSAVGFVGFVAIIGGAIEWIRFDAAELPATQAVLAVPKQELVIVGALVLGMYVVAAMLAVLVVYLIDSNGNATPRTAYGLIAVGVVELGMTLFFIGGHNALKYVWVGFWLIWTLLVASYIVGLVMLDFRRRTKVKHARTRVLRAQGALTAAVDAEVAAAQHDDPDGKAQAQAADAVQKAREQFLRAVEEWTFAARQVIDVQRRSMRKSDRKDIARRLERVKAVAEQTPGIVEVEAAMDDAERRLGHAYRAATSQATERITGVPGADDDSDLPEVRTVSVALGYAVVVIGVGFYFFVQDVSWAAVLFIVVALLTTMNVFVARATDRFALYGVAVFFSVLLFGAALTIARTLHEPKVQPVALVRKDNEVGTCGVYITQTSDRVYVGRLPSLGKRPGEIFWVRTSDVDLVSVGQPEKIEQDKYKKRFSSYAKSMLERLYEDRAEEAAQTLKNKTTSEVGKKPASKKQAQRIHGLHVVTNTETSEVPSKKMRSKRHASVTIDGANCTAAQHVDA